MSFSPIAKTKPDATTFKGEGEFSQAVNSCLTQNNDYHISVSKKKALRGECGGPLALHGGGRRYFFTLPFSMMTLYL
jgi:hypothetical protein